MGKFYYEDNDIGLRGTNKEEYIKNMYAWANDDDVTYYMVTGLYPANLDKLEKDYSDFMKGDNIIFAIIEQKTNKTLGFVGLYNINKQTRSAEFRIIIGNKENHRKGVGTIITKYLVVYGFEKLNLNKVWLGVNVENKGAVGCYKKAGFVTEGILRQEIFRNNRYYDAIRMSILRNEYETKK